MSEQRLGNSPEWKNRKLDVDTVKLKFNNLDDAYDVEHPEKISGILHMQWVRRDLLGMPKRWDYDDLTLTIPKEALDRVIEELVDFKIDFTVI